MNFLTDEKLLIVGAAGMIGSNMAQTAIMMRLTPNICLYDPYAKGLKGVAEEMLQCGFEGMNITYTDDIETAFTGAKYIVSSGGAPRKEGMTREDLLAGNCKIAEDFGKNVRKYCPDVKHIVVIFNPADITGLVTLLYSGVKPGCVHTGRTGQHTSAQRAGQVVQDFPGSDHQLPHIRRPRRADGRIRQHHDGKRQASDRDYRHRSTSRE